MPASIRRDDGDPLSELAGIFAAAILRNAARTSAAGAVSGEIDGEPSVSCLAAASPIGLSVPSGLEAPETREKRSVSGWRST
jgi:hypothetical protein